MPVQEPDEAYAGIGASGVPQGGQLAQDLMALSDPAKRIAETRQPAVEANAAQNLKLAQQEKAAQMRSLDEQAADAIMLKMHKADRPAYAKSLAERIADLEKQAADVQKSGTGNVLAQNTFIQVANILKRRLQRLQDEEAGTGGEGS